MKPNEELSIAVSPKSLTEGLKPKIVEQMKNLPPGVYHIEDEIYIKSLNLEESEVEKERRVAAGNLKAFELLVNNPESPYINCLKEFLALARKWDETNKEKAEKLDVIINKSGLSSPQEKFDKLVLWIKEYC